jgi:glycosyltransferase involved in cell wall biosynthesis
MKVCITTITTTDKFTGVALYLQKLIHYLQEIDTKNQYIVITTVDNSKFFEIKKENFKEIRLPLNQRSFFSRVFLHVFNIFFFPIVLLIYRVKVVHYPNTMFITRFVSKTVITIHDIVDQKVNKYGKLRNFYRRFLVKRALRHATKVITVSNNSRKDLEEVFPREINMIYNGYDRIGGNKRSIVEGEILKKYEVTSHKYLVAIGTLLKHKNIPRLIRVFSKYLNQNELAPFDRLLIIGHKENDYNSIVSEIEKNKVSDKVKILDFISNDEKFVLLQNSFSFIFFSLYEGFGFPILEAQELQVPVVVLDTSCLKEVAGEYSLIVSNESDDAKVVNQLAEHFCKLTNENYRKGIVSSALSNLDRFSWFDCAKNTHDLYEQCA